MKGSPCGIASAEVGIVCEYNPPFRRGSGQNRNVRYARQTERGDIDDRESFTAQKRDLSAVDILIRQDRELAELHATLALR